MGESGVVSVIRAMAVPCRVLRGQLVGVRLDRMIISGTRSWACGTSCVGRKKRVIPTPVNRWRRCSA